MPRGEAERLVNVAEIVASPPLVDALMRALTSSRDLTYAARDGKHDR